MDEVGSPYFLMLALGFAAAFAWALRRAESRGLGRLVVIDACIAALVGGLVGSRLLHVLVEPLPAYALDDGGRARVGAALPGLDPLTRAAAERALTRPEVPAAWEFVVLMPAGAARDEAVAAVERDPAHVPARLWYRARPLEVLAFWKGGLAYLGGLLLATALALGATARHRAPLGAMADLAAPAIALGLVFGRVGCFLGGCCYGEVCAPAWWAVQPGWYEPPIGGVPRFPTALLEAAWNLGVFAALARWLRRTPPEGPRWGPFLGLLALYAPGRFAIEALRADPRGGALGLSTSQLLAVLTGAPAALVLAWRAWRARATR